MGLRDTFKALFAKRTVDDIVGEVARIHGVDTISGIKFRQYNPSSLVGRKGLKVFDDMRKDEQVKASMTFKKNAVTASGWEIVSPEGYPDDWEVTRFLEWNLRNLVGTLEHDIHEILTSLDYGYSVTEKVFSTVESGEWAGMIALREMKTRKPHHFRFETDEFGNLVALVQDDGYRERPLPIEKFVVLTNEFEFSNWYGTSDLESAYRPWWAKDNAYKWLSILIERMGIPPIFGLYDKDVFHGKILNRLKTALQNIQVSTVGIVPRTTKDSLEFWTPQLASNTKDVFMPAIEMYDKHIARALLMPNQIGMSPETNVGSFAKAKVHFDVFMMVIEKIRNNDIEERVMNEQVIPQLVDLNFAGVTDYPRFRFLPLSDDVTNDLLQTWVQLVNGGIVTRQPDDEAHIRSALKMPEVTSTDQLPPDGTAPSSSPMDGPSGEGAFFALARTPDRYEAKVDFAAISRTLDGIEAQAKTAIQDELKMVRDRFIKKVENKFKFNTVFINNIKLPMGNVTELLKETFRTSLQYGRKEVRRELSGANFAEVQDATIEPTSAIRYITQQGVTAAGVLRSELEKRVTIVLTNALKYGWTMREIRARLQDEFLPFVGDDKVIADDGVLEPYRLDNIIRTNTTNAFNHGRLVEMRQDSDFVHAVEYSAILDDRTTEVCRFLDGKKFRLDDPQLDTLTPPNHYQCRSVLVPITIDEQVPADEFVTAAQVGKAKDLATKGFV